MTCRIMQFGTSRFLQAHVDLFVSEALGRGEAAGPIAVVQTTGNPESRRRIEGFRRLRPFPVRLRGRRGGTVVDAQVAVASVAAAWHADEDGPAVERQFIEEIRYVVCNTGDRGWTVADDAASPPGSRHGFPARLLALLRARHRAGAPPVVVLPCELVSENGTTLRDLLCGLAARGNDEPGFLAWLREGCVWGNSLVDRIVSEALEPVGAVAEPYALWAIEARPGLDVPCRHPDVRVVDDLRPYERLKLFILNLGHTVLAERWLASADPARPPTVGEAIADPAARDALLGVYEAEVLPVFAALGMSGEAQAYRDAVLERFANPFLHHRLADIATNHGAKKRRRIAPLLALGKEVGVRSMPRLRQYLASGLGDA